jgi:photosystem II protein PsbQ
MSLNKLKSDYKVMPRFRSILALVLVLVTTFLVSCGGAPETKVPPTYTPEKIEQLQVLINPIEEAREKMAIVADLIAKKNWVDTRTYIHGPLGQLRLQMLNLSRSLLPKDRQQAADLAKDLFAHFERIDFAAKDKNADLAYSQFQEAVKVFDRFLSLLPTADS